jgi:hypothetical protein
MFRTRFQKEIVAEFLLPARSSKQQKANYSLWHAFDSKKAASRGIAFAGRTSGYTNRGEEILAGNKAIL